MHFDISLLHDYQLSHVNHKHSTENTACHQYRLMSKISQNSTIHGHPLNCDFITI